MCRQLESTKRTNQQYTKSYSMTLYFIDMAFLDETLAHTRPSLIAAAGSPLDRPHTLFSSSPPHSSRFLPPSRASLFEIDVEAGVEREA